MQSKREVEEVRIVMNSGKEYIVFPGGDWDYDELMDIILTPKHDELSDNLIYLNTNKNINITFVPSKSISTIETKYK